MASFFQYRSPLNQLIEINGTPFRIIGIVESETDQLSKYAFIPRNSQRLVEGNLIKANGIVSGLRMQKC
ncbi:hypothetical protein [Enterococcus mundtii]|uniref:hypothetical protein n=1 Tax=Enterococcus mundtii TaxID=53346 RepID=UPI0035C673D3